MDTLSQKTVNVNKVTATKEWVVVDATDQVLGRLCTKVAKLLRGKYKPNFTPYVDCGDNVIIVNAEKIVLTGSKMTANICATLVIPVVRRLALPPTSSLRRTVQRSCSAR